MATIIRNETREAAVYNVPGVGAVHLPPGGESAPLDVSELGPEVRQALRRRPALVSVRTTP